ncbi:post-transcriptional regulator [Anoxybacteroides tepidamans]|uniref:post-transcriptional regulator n=1 Tax=Anoxybacteroides tepidamans TaxID=265948 RepID=UPI0004897151|nr:post-transcriptional regulator [Anoxybacillus tepidamans]
MEQKRMEALREQLMPAVECKYDEFRLLGYDHVTIEQIWNCLCNKKWKKIDDEKKLYEFVNDILSLSIGEYMAFLTAESYRTQRSGEDNNLETILSELL